MQAIAEIQGFICRTNSKRCVSGRRTVATGARVNGAKATDWLVIQVATRTATAINRFGVEQLLQRLVVLRAALTLKGDRAVPLKAVGFQGTKNEVGRPGLRSGWVDVLNAHQPTTSVLASFKEARNGGDQGAEM